MRKKIFIQNYKLFLFTFMFQIFFMLKNNIYDELNFKKVEGFSGNNH